MDENWDLLAGVSKVECPNCGAENVLSDDRCDECGAELGEEDAPGLSLLAGDRDRKVHKIPVHEARNLQKLKAARDGLLFGGWSDEQYDEAIDEILHLTKAGVALNRSPVVQRKIAKMKPEEARLFKEMGEAFEDLHEAVEKMTSRVPEDVEQGLAEFEAGLWRVDAIQDRAEQLDD